MTHKVLEPVRSLTLLCGLSGSGKSTLVAQLIEQATALGVPRDQIVVCSADDYFYKWSSMHPDSRQYSFDPTKLGEAHAACFHKAADAVMHHKRYIIIDNTNTTNVARAPYYMLAQAYEYPVYFVRVGTLKAVDRDKYAERNKHGVPLSTIEAQALRYEAPLPFWKMEIV